MNDFISSEGVCVDCSKGKFPTTKEEVGKKVVIDETVGRGFSKTVYQYFQCQKCGSIWQRCIDSGAGGHGTYDTRITN